MGIKIATKDVELYLSKIADKINGNEIDQILEKSAKPILEEMDKNVPTDTLELKGTLGVIKIEGSGTNKKMHLGSTSKDRKVVERAYYQEYGTVYMIGNKWLSTSATNAKYKALEILKSEVMKIIDK
ncbi:MAG: HK97 gp10 family phage protein [Peptostreptococcaceae bacterium]